MIRHSSTVAVALLTLTFQKFLLIHCLLLSVLNDPVVQSSVTSFWITVEPLAVTWTTGCLAAAGCNDSKLTIAEWNLVSDERISSSWSINELFVSFQIN